MSRVGVYDANEEWDDLAARCYCDARLKHPSCRGARSIDACMAHCVTYYCISRMIQTVHPVGEFAAPCCALERSNRTY